MSNHYAVHLKIIQYCVSTVMKNKKIIQKKNSYRLFQSTYAHMKQSFQLWSFTYSEQFGEIFHINSWETYCNFPYSLLYFEITVSFSVTSLLYSFKIVLSLKRPNGHHSYKVYYSPLCSHVLEYSSSPSHKYLSFSKSSLKSKYPNKQKSLSWP